MSSIINLSITQVILAYVFVLVLYVIVKIRGIRRKREIVISSIRMTLQLILVGWLLRYIFDHPSPWITVLIIAVMEIFALHTIFAKFKGKLSRGLVKVTALSISVGTLTSLIYFLFVVVRITPWYDPRYFIPVAGMLIGNSMTGISLGIHSLTEGMTAKRALVEEALILGATPRQAAKSITDNAFDAAILPTLNSMLGMGIVFLPGMMTGQILSGTSPTTAITYQIAIMLGIMGAVSLSVILMVQLGYRTYFNNAHQLIDTP